MAKRNIGNEIIQGLEDAVNYMRIENKMFKNEYKEQIVRMSLKNFNNAVESLFYSPKDPRVADSIEYQHAILERSINEYRKYFLKQRKKRDEIQTTS